MKSNKFTEQIERLEAAYNFTIHKGALPLWKKELENAGIREDIDLENGVQRSILSGGKYFPTVGELIQDCHEERGIRLRDLHEKKKNEKAGSLQETFKKAADRSGTKLAKECCEIVIALCNRTVHCNCPEDVFGDKCDLCNRREFKKRLKDMEDRYPKFRSNVKLLF